MEATTSVASVVRTARQRDLDLPPVVATMLRAPAGSRRHPGETATAPTHFLHRNTPG